MVERLFRLGYKAARRVVVGVVGGTVVLLGCAMLVLPGPAFIVIPVGLGILGLEFAWARRWLRKLKETATATASKFQSNPEGSDAPGASPSEGNPADSSDSSDVAGDEAAVGAAGSTDPPASLRG